MSWGVKVWRNGMKNGGNAKTPMTPHHCLPSNLRFEKATLRRRQTTVRWVHLTHLFPYHFTHLWCRASKMHSNPPPRTFHLHNFLNPKKYIRTRVHTKPHFCTLIPPYLHTISFRRCIVHCNRSGAGVHTILYCKAGIKSWKLKDGE